jgi:hypothetical protein
VQGTIIGATLALLTAILIMNAVGRAITTTVNGWSAIRKCGQPGNEILVRAACAKNARLLWGAVNFSAPLNDANNYVRKYCQ